MAFAELHRVDKVSQYVSPDQVAAVTTDPIHSDLTLITLASGGFLSVTEKPDVVIAALKKAKNDGG